MWARYLSAVLAVTMICLQAGAEQGIETLLVIDASNEHPRNSEGDIEELKDGRLCLVYTRFIGTPRDDSPAELVMRTSSDGGKTWSSDRVLVPNEGGCNVMEANILRLKNGELLLFYLRKDKPTLSCNLFVRRSSNEFGTLSEPTRVTLLDGYHVVNNDRVIQLSTGRLIVPAVLHTGFDEAGKVTIFVRQGIPFIYYSDDNGYTWKKDNTVITPTSQRKLTLHENGVVELKDGRLWMYMRTGHGYQYGCYSADGGLNWSEPKPTKLASPVSPATIERIPWTGQLLCVWNDHSGVHPFTPGKRTPFCAAISKDEGLTWSKSKIIEDNPKGWFCYTSMTFLKDRVLLSYGGGERGLDRLKVAALSQEWLAGCAAETEQPQGPTAFLQPCLDYGRSFINTTSTVNSPRFWVESRCRISDPATGQSVEYYQCGSCKSENTFPRYNLFKENNYDFLPIFCDSHNVIFRRWAQFNERYHEVRGFEKAWGQLIPCLRTFNGRVLAGPEEVFEAMTAGKLIIGQTKLVDEQTGRTAVIEYPVKTINRHWDTKKWQVDTGPILLPDLTVPADKWSQNLRLAYIAFNAPDRADFVVEQPTAVTVGDKEAAKVYHYSGLVPMKTCNVLLALDED